MVFDSQELPYATLGPGSTTFAGNAGAPFIASGGLEAWSGTTGASVAANYAFIFNLQQCAGACPSYQTIANLYDWFKLKKVSLTLKPAIDPKRDITTSLQTGSGAAYDFTGALTYDPDMTMVDYDGVRLAFACPANGDCTQIVYNRANVRKHRAFGTIRRTFYPRLLSMHPQVGQVNGQQSNSPAYPNNSNEVGSGVHFTAAVTTTYRKGPRYGWMRSSLDGSYTGTLSLFTSYKGSNSFTGGSNNQPFYNWAIQSKWFVAYRDTIYG